MSGSEFQLYDNDDNDKDNNFAIENSKKTRRIKKKERLLVETRTTPIVKRKRTKPNRFGKRVSSSNHNDFFVSLAVKKQKLDQDNPTGSNPTELDDSNMHVETVEEVDFLQENNRFIEANEIENITSGIQQNEIDEKLSIFLNSMGLLLDARFKEFESNFNCKFETLQRQLARIEVRLNQRRVSQSSGNESDVIEQSYLTELQTLGFPLKTIEELNAFQEKLKDPNHEKSMVNMN